MFGQASAVSGGLDPSTIIWALAGVVTTLGGLLLKGWQERVKRSEAAERTATDALLGQVRAELDRALERETAKDARIEYLENQRAKVSERVLEVIDKLRAKSEAPRSASPNPTSYSITTQKSRIPRS